MVKQNERQSERESQEDKTEGVGWSRSCAGCTIWKDLGEILASTRSVDSRASLTLITRRDQRLLHLGGV